MFRFAPHIVSLSLVMGMGIVPTPQASNALLIQLCSGNFVRLDIGQDDTPPPQPTHSKPCHAICCQRNGDQPDVNEPDDDDLKV